MCSIKTVLVLNRVLPASGVQDALKTNVKSVCIYIHRGIYIYIICFFLYLHELSIAAQLVSRKKVVPRIFFFCLKEDWGKLIPKYEKAATDNLAYTEKVSVYFFYLIILCSHWLLITMPRLLFIKRKGSCLEKVIS